MHDFVARLEEINQLAERSPGFIWRLKAEDGRSSSYVQAFDDDRILINMSTWQSIEALRAYVYRSEHAQLLRQRAQWFVPMPEPALALWHRETIRPGWFAWTAPRAARARGLVLDARCATEPLPCDHASHCLSSAAGARKPWTLPEVTMASTFRQVSEGSVKSMAAMFSSALASVRVPGIGMMSSPACRSQPSAS